MAPFVISANVPESARVTVDGREIGIHDLKVGMKLQKTVTTTTTPQIVTTVRTVTRQVWHVSPPNTPILTLEDGNSQQFTIPDGQQFNIDGHIVNASGLRAGMKISAAMVVEEPVTSVNVKKQLSRINASASSAAARHADFVSIRPNECRPLSNDVFARR